MPSGFFPSVYQFQCICCLCWWHVSLLFSAILTLNLHCLMQSFCKASEVLDLLFHDVPGLDMSGAYVVLRLPYLLEKSGIWTVTRHNMQFSKTCWHLAVQTVECCSSIVHADISQCLWSISTCQFPLIKSVVNKQTAEVHRVPSILRNGYVQWCSWNHCMSQVFNIICPPRGDPALADQTPACEHMASYLWLCGSSLLSHRHLEAFSATSVVVWMAVLSLFSFLFSSMPISLKAWLKNGLQNPLHPPSTEIHLTLHPACWHLQTNPTYLESSFQRLFQAIFPWDCQLQQHSLLGGLRHKDGLSDHMVVA